MGAPRAPPQSGILAGGNPSVYQPTNPIVSFIIQAGIIIIFTRLLHLPLQKLRQPRVIAEVIGGILLGPSVFGRVPGFTNAIFPAPSMPTLNTAANIGLILFLFLVGLEVDLRLLVGNWRIALSVGAAGMALPFGFGLAIAYGLYHQFREDSGLIPISFGTYMLFVGVAMAITAFPVLCRILTELNLLQTQVGVVVLSAGVGNDIVGWILLALCVALVNAGSGITALYVLLVAVGWILFLVYAVRPAFIWLLRRSGSLQNGPTQSIVALTVLLVFTSAFFTSIIGVHPIFGAFLVGVICPHEGGFAIKLTEKIEDLVAVFFLPLYFALSGLSTNLGLLDDGITWAYVVGVIAVAFIGKVVGGTLAARSCKMVWRESFTVGVLMSCKGLVELIVLNIGLQAKILSQRTFTIFVVMALVTTFATTPLVSFLFPPAYQKKLAAWKRGEIDWDGNRLMPDGEPTDESSASALEKSGHDIRKLLVCLRLDSLPSLFTFISLLSEDKSGTVSKPKIHPSKSGKLAEDTGIPNLQRQRPLEIHGIRMLELTERLSSVMKESEVDDWSPRDPVVNAFYTFGQLNNVAVSGEVQLIPLNSYADTLTSSASHHSSDLILLPWSETNSISELHTLGFTEPTQSPFSNDSYNHLVARFLSKAPCPTAVFINNGFGTNPRSLHPDDLSKRPTLSRSLTGASHRSEQPLTIPLADRTHHIFFPYTGGADSHTALRFVLRLARSPNVTATILLVNTTTSTTSSSEPKEPTPEISPLAHPSSPTSPSKKLPFSPTFPSTTNPLTQEDITLFHTLRDSLPTPNSPDPSAPSLADRVLFDTLDTTTPYADVAARAGREVGQTRGGAGDLVVVPRGSIASGGGGADEIRGERGGREVLGAWAEVVLGVVGTAGGGVGGKASVLVVQAGGGGGVMM